MNDGAITITVSDPWSLPAENEGCIAFVADIVGRANGKWLVRFRRTVVFEETEWHFAIPTARFVGQTYFEGRDTAADILFITDEQAESEAFLSAFDSTKKPSTPWVIGSVERGIASIIARGEDAYAEPTWKKPSSA